MNGKHRTCPRCRGRWPGGANTQERAMGTASHKECPQRCAIPALQRFAHSVLLQTWRVSVQIPTALHFCFGAQTEQHRVQVSPAGRCTGQTLTQSGQVQHGNQWPLHTYSVSDGADMPVQAVQNCASCSKMGPCRRQLGSTNALATMVMFESAVKHDMNRLWYCRTVPASLSTRRDSARHRMSRCPAERP